MIKAREQRFPRQVYVQSRFPSLKSVPLVWSGQDRGLLCWSLTEIGKLTVLVSAEVGGNDCGKVMCRLTQKVDVVIQRILDTEGCDGYEAPRWR